MTDVDRIQAGIFFRSGQKPPACFRLLLLNFKAAAQRDAAADAVRELVDLLQDLTSAPSAAAEQPESALFGGLTATLAYGRRFFDTNVHAPALTDLPRPSYLSYLDRHANAFPAIPWHPAALPGAAEADLAVQLTGPHDAAVDCAIVEICQRAAESYGLLAPVGSFSGFGRPDGRGWLGFHDGVSNLASPDRLAAIEAAPVAGWMAGGTFMAFLRLRVDLAQWRGIPRVDQEALVGRDRATGRPLGSAGTDEAFRDPPETSCAELDTSHVHRANQSRASAAAPGSLRIFRQGYDYLASAGPAVPDLGLNFVSFQADLAVLQHLLHLPGWLGDSNFGGDPGPAFISLAAGGLYAVPPVAAPFPGAVLFSPPDRKQQT